MIKTINPATNQEEKHFNSHSSKEVEQKLQNATAAFEEWKDQTFAKRGEVLYRCAEILEERKEELSYIMVKEMGKPLKQAQGETEKCAWVCRYYAEHAEAFLKDRPLESDAPVGSQLVYDPVGTILAVMPWNFPLWQVFRFAAPALMAGNVGLLKHASNVPQCALAIEDVLLRAGLPEGAFQTLLISNSQTEALIPRDEIRGVTLTGSEQAGAKVAAIAGANIKKTVLELGGSDPFIVLNDADIDQAAAVSVQSRLINSGQSCIAAKRFIVERNVIDQFLEKVAYYMEQYKEGDPNEPDTDLGPLARKDLADDLERQMNDSVKAGAEIYFGGNRPHVSGNYFNPTILKNVRPGMPAFDEETFGPLYALVEADDEAHAISLANQSRYGLGASLWTSNRDKGAKLARKIDAGNICINGMVKSDPRLPFGGVKKSGYGRELSFLGIREFVNQKTVWTG